ncbi:hypothetical protein COR50_02180 [Chitinophaga caeni]|uniref:Uncharacterized protein n=1 Tax=Chitinophaga caeni TaxID=2029983 RepID=A0A291QQ69_9BACT|nr:hypothetical protein [Chitinophaga caeni]ATL46065.1 hypothetical protein COR50_02180 [Chitinophaga caeni]
MKKRTYIINTLALLIILGLASCDKEGDKVVPNILALKPFQMSGFVIGDTLEQYFDNQKVRELYGRNITYSNFLFDKDVMEMEFRSKRSGKVVHTQQFNIKNDSAIVPNFYYDGKQFSGTYDYPAVEGTKFLVNFYADLPADAAPMDIVIEAEEIIYDYSTPPYMFTINSYTIPLVQNINPREWTEYIEIKLSGIEKTDPESQIQAYVFMKKSGSDEYYCNNSRNFSYIGVQMPGEYTTQGLVASWYLGYTDQNSNISIEPQINLVDIFR